jgi:hypothetical protein
MVKWIAAFIAKRPGKSKEDYSAAPAARCRDNSIWAGRWNKKSYFCRMPKL